MSKTVSTVLSVAALLGAAGAGAAFYFIHEEQLATAMKRTEWLDSKADAINNPESEKDVDNPDFIARPTDEKTRNGTVFVNRMFKVEQLKRKLDDKREKVIAQRKTIEARDATIQERDQTITNKNENITQLESEKAELTRDRDTLRSDLARARGQVAQLESEKQANQAEIQRLGAEMKDESKYMPRDRFDEEVKNRQKSEDNLTIAARRYTELWNWTSVHATERIPKNFTSVLNFNAQTAVDPIPAPVRVTAPIATKIVTVDLSKGMLALLLGPDGEGLVKPGAYFNVHLGEQSIGRVRLTNVGNNLSTAEILPGAQLLKFTRDTSVTLLPTQTTVKTAVPRAATPAETAPAATPAAGGDIPPPPAP